MISITKYEKAINVVKEGNINLFKRIYNSYSSKNKFFLIHHKNYEISRWAAYSGDLKIFKFIYDKCYRDKQIMLSAQNYRAAIWAAAEGHIDILNFIYIKCDNKEDMLELSGKYAAKFAVEANYIEVFKFIYDKSIDKEKILYAGVKGAIAGDHVEIFEQIYNQISNKIVFLSESIQLVIQKGHNKIFEFIYNQSENKQKILVDAIQHSALSNDIDNLKIYALKLKGILGYSFNNTWPKIEINNQTDEKIKYYFKNPEEFLEEINKDLEDKSNFEKDKTKNDQKFWQNLVAKSKTHKTLYLE